MATWNTLQEHMRVSYQLEEDQADVMAMVWRYDDGRSQRIIVRKYQAFERDMIEFKSPFARQEAIDPLKMIQRNRDLPLGTIALSGETYIVVYNTLLSSLDVQDFDFFLSRVASGADALEEEFGKRDVF